MSAEALSAALLPLVGFRFRWSRRCPMVRAVSVQCVVMFSAIVLSG